MSQPQEVNCRCFVSYGYPSKEVGNVEQPFDLAPAFSQYGTIVDIDYFETKPIAFVEFTNSEAAAFAIYNLNGSFHQGRKLKVNWAKKKEDEVERKKDGVEGENKEKKEEKKVTEITRPDTPVGGLRVDSGEEKPKKKKRAQKTKKNVVREIQYPSIETPPSTPPTQTNQQQESSPNTTQNQNTGGKNKNQQNQNKNQQNQNKNQNTGGKNQQNQNKNQNTGGKKKGRQQNYEVIVRNVDTDESFVVAVLTDNGPEVTDQENFDKFLVDGLGLSVQN